MNAHTTRTVIAAGETLPIIDHEWEGALIVVTVGTIELECHESTTHTFSAGSILWFCDLGLRAVRNHDATPATILSTRRGPPA